MRTTLLCAALLALLPVAAQAQSATAAMQDFGLLGTWAGECSQDPSPNNNHATYLVTAAGGLQLKYQSGADFEESIYDIFSWAEGDFRFLDDILPESAMVPMKMDVTGIVMEGVQRVDERHDVAFVALVILTARSRGYSRHSRSVG